MKKYYPNKGFVPYSFIKKYDSTNYKSDKRGLILLVILALILFPISIDKLFDKEEVIEKPIEVQEEGIDKKDITSWYYIMEDGTDGIISNEVCKLKIYDKEVLEKILVKENISINSIENLGENKYELDIIKEKQ